MIFARLLAGAGELSKAGFMCDECERSGRKVKRGCMVPPIMDGYHKGEWSHARYIEYCEANDMDPQPKDAGWWYEDANYWDISRFCDGELWDCCPRSYSEFADRATIIAADEMIQAAGDIRAGLPESWILGGALPTVKAKSLITTALQVLGELHARNLRDA